MAHIMVTHSVRRNPQKPTLVDGLEVRRLAIGANVEAGQTGIMVEHLMQLDA